MNKWEKQGNLIDCGCVMISEFRAMERVSVKPLHLWNVEEWQ